MLFVCVCVCEWETTGGSVSEEDEIFGVEEMPSDGGPDGKSATKITLVFGLGDNTMAGLARTLKTIHVISRKKKHNKKQKENSIKRLNVEMSSVGQRLNQGLKLDPKGISQSPMVVEDF